MRTNLFFLTIFVLWLASCGEKNEVIKDPVNCPPMTLPYPATGSICNSFECQQYQSIWKELFITKSALTDDFFNRHIQVYSTKIVSSPAHEYFYVYYNVKVDWVTTNACDSFLIKTNGIEFPQIQLPVDQYLNKNQVQAFISQYHYLNKINPITKQEKLIYTSMEDAKSKLKDYLICPMTFVLGPSDGHIILLAKTSFAGGPVVESYEYFTKKEGQ